MKNLLALPVSFNLKYDTCFRLWWNSKPMKNGNNYGILFTLPFIRLDPRLLPVYNSLFNSKATGCWLIYLPAAIWANTISPTGLLLVPTYRCYCIQLLCLRKNKTHKQKNPNKITLGLKLWNHPALMVEMTICILSTRCRHITGWQDPRL